ncbi:MAG: type II toxin-antitoxin system HigB family toxin [Verrucomicrobiales bacterium]|nr:type II toxin-antitoxin system HigB family toxin [Verrucomicrobiales bacterium]
MKLIGRDLLEEFSQRHADVLGALQSWIKEVESATWTKPQDVRNRYRSADFLSGNRIIFNIKGNSYRLVVVVVYHAGVARVQWIGTHADYDKQRF